MSIFSRHPDRDADLPPSDRDEAAPLPAGAPVSNSAMAARAAAARLRFKNGPAEHDAEAEHIAEEAFRGAPGEVPHRDEMERSFGDTSGVAAHTDEHARATTRALGAEAMTLGDRVAFAEANPSQETVAHELAHVAQQRRGPGSRANDEAEAEAAERGDARRPLDLHGGARAEAPALRMKKVERDTIPQAEIAAGGKGAKLTDEQIAKAISYNDKKWKDAHRYQIIWYLRGTMGPIAPDPAFEKADVERVAELQKGAGVPDDKVDGMIGDTTMAILLHAGLSLSKVDGVKPGDVRLVFYPGEFEDIKAWEASRDAGKAREGHQDDYNEYRATVAPDGVGKLYVKVNGNLVDKMDVRGGPPIKLKDGSHTADPSKAGTYKLGKGAPYRTNSWYNSQIRWGAEIRERSDGEIEFKDPGSSKWKIATGDKSVLKTPMNRSDFLDKKGNLLTKWEKNDFGAEAWRVRGSPGLFIHTTPYSERLTLSGKDPELAHSHGCLHVKPQERDKLKARGYLQGGVTLVIKSYESHLLPDHMRAMMESATPLAGSTP